MSGFQNWGPGNGFQAVFCCSPCVTWAKCSPASGLSVPISEMGCVSGAGFCVLAPSCGFLLRGRPLFFLGLRGPLGVYSLRPLVWRQWAPGTFRHDPVSALSSLICTKVERQWRGSQVQEVCGVFAHASASPAPRLLMKDLRIANVFSGFSDSLSLSQVGKRRALELFSPDAKICPIGALSTFHGHPLRRGLQGSGDPKIRALPPQLLPAVQCSLSHN